MDNLLTPQEISIARRKAREGQIVQTDDAVIIAREQDKKTHQKDIEWLEEPCPHGTLSEDTSTAERRECPECWKEFKKL